MTSEKKDFFGKEVADAIREACKEFQVEQEQLEIEVIETGSTGIFGLIRKKARIRAKLKGPEVSEEPEAAAIPDSTEVRDEEVVDHQEPAVEAAEESATVVEEEKDATTIEENNGTEELSDDAVEELPQEALDIIRQELVVLLDLMGYGSEVEISAKGASVHCHVEEKHEDILTGQEGKTLDSIQYLLRKIIARKVPNRLRLSVDVGNYREKRLEELKVKAAELAESVKANGKTQVIAALSPSERRVVHMSLQDDKEIRSRSVGDGLFKKILIYKPGKGNKGGGRKRGNQRGRRSSSGKKKD